MPDLSDTVAKCRMGTAKNFYTSIASLSHINKIAGHEAADGWAWFDSAGHYPRSGTYQHDAECCLIVCYGNNLLYFLLRMTCGQFVRRSFL